MEGKQIKEKKGYTIDIPTEVLFYINDMTLPTTEDELKNLLKSLSTGSGLGYYFYFISDAPHPKLIKHLKYKFNSFNTVLNGALEYAKRGHDKYMSILVSTNTISKVIYERDKYIYQLSEWESVCTIDTFSVKHLQHALLATGSLHEAAINCGLDKDTLIEVLSDSQLNGMIERLIKPV
jgi:hypothetical protein